MSLHSPSSKWSHGPTSVILDLLIKQIYIIYHRFEVTLSTTVLTPGEPLALEHIWLVLLSGHIGHMPLVPWLLTNAVSGLVWLFSSLREALNLFHVKNGIIAWQYLRLVTGFEALGWFTAVVC